MKLDSKTVTLIAEELRITRIKGTNKIAFNYVYNKYKHLFESEFQFLYLMEIASTFWCSRGEQVEIDRENTIYKYV